MKPERKGVVFVVDAGTRTLGSLAMFGVAARKSPLGAGLAPSLIHIRFFVASAQANPPIPFFGQHGGFGVAPVPFGVPVHTGFRAAFWF